MTRKDYVLLASAFATALGDCPTEQSRYGVWHAMRVVARSLKADNPSFDVIMFNDAVNEQYQVIKANQVWGR